MFLIVELLRGTNSNVRDLGQKSLTYILTMWVIDSPESTEINLVDVEVDVEE